MLTVQQLLTPQIAAQVRATMVTALQGLGLQPQRWAQGGIASSTLTVAANVVAALSVQLSNAIAQNWNPTASGGGLQLLSKYFYGFTPPQPTFASGVLQLTNTGGGSYSYAAGGFTVASTVANAAGVFPLYTNEAPFSLGPGTPSSPTVVTFEIECSNVQGTGGNANPGFVSNLVTQLQGVAATNPNAIVGNDALTDPALRALNIASLAVQSVFGPRGAYAYAIQTAVNASTGLPVNVNRCSISISSHTGEVTIVVASPAGPVSTTDLEGISNNIELLARPDAVTVLPGLPGYPSAPASATPVSYAPTVAVYVQAPIGTTPASLETVIDDALTAWFQSPANPIGGVTATDDSGPQTGIFESGVSGVIAAAVGAIPNCYMLATRFTGESDLPLASGEVASNGITNLTVYVQSSPGGST